MTNQDDQWLQRVRYTAAEPTSWLHHALTLRQAAEDLWIAGNAHDRNPGSELGTTVLAKYSDPDFVRPEMGGSTRDVCFMLFGFALENLAKGVIVCREPKLVSQVRLKSWHGNGHNLRALFEWSKIQVTEEESKLLDRTNRMTEWKGRYPVAMSFYDVGLHDPVAGHIAIGQSWPLDDFQGLSGLYDKAKAILVQTMEETPPLPGDYNFG